MSTAWLLALSEIQALTYIVLVLVPLNLLILVGSVIYVIRHR